MKRSMTWMVATLVLTAFLTSCGLGTEIGNGFKPEGKKKGDAKGAGAPENANSDDESGGDGDESESPVLGEDVQPSLSLLFTSCTGFFAEPFELPFALKVGDGVIWHVSAADGDVIDIKDSADELLWTIDRVDPNALVIKDAADQAHADDYTCLAPVERKVTEQDDGTFVEAASVTLERASDQVTVTWSTTYAAKDAETVRLQDVQITNEDQSKTAAYEASY